MVMIIMSDVCFLISVHTVTSVFGALSWHLTPCLLSGYKLISSTISYFLCSILVSSYPLNNILISLQTLFIVSELRLEGDVKKKREDTII